MEERLRNVNPIHTMRMLLFKIFTLDVDESFDDLIVKLRNSVYFMGKTATIPVDELSIQTLEYASILGAVQGIIGSQLPISQKYYMMYISHLFDLDPNVYGLAKQKHSA